MIVEEQKLNLKVEIDNNSGFCFGVVYAIEMAEQILDSGEELYCLGDIVHNDIEVDRLKKKGLKIIKSKKEFSALHDVKVLIRAHGEPPETYQLALENNITLIDASCPVVLKLQNRIKKAHDKKKPILVYGKHGHAEVIGIKGQTNNEAVVFQSMEELDSIDLPPSFSLYSQTTKSIDSFYKIVDKLTKKGYEVDTNDTICRQVSNRDKDLKMFAQRFDIILFVSGIKSSNGRVLYEVCKKVNPNTRFITSEEEVQPNFFTKNNKVGICGATSTPMWLMENIKEKILSF